jgi:quercetin dioxygenase-like cupin family protein
MSLHPVAAHSESVSTLDVLGTTTRILLDGKQTHGAFALVEVIGRPGDCIPPHVHHREEETFHVVEGELELWYAGHLVRLRAGDTFFAPRNIPHSPKFIGGGHGRVLVTLTPAGFERAFRELDSLAAQGTVAPEAAAKILEGYGCEFLAQPRA